MIILIRNIMIFRTINKGAVLLFYTIGGSNE